MAKCAYCLLLLLMMYITINTSLQKKSKESYKDCASSVSFTSQAKQGEPGSRCPLVQGDNKCDLGLECCNEVINGHAGVCADIDECSTGAHNCHSAAICHNNIGAYTCECSDGFVGNGTSCEEIDHCCLEPSTTPGSATFYSYGVDAGDERAPIADDGCPTSYTFPINMFGVLRNKAYVCYNGLVTMDGVIEGHVDAKFPLSSGVPTIAPYFTDINLEGGGNLYSRISTSACVLDRAAAELEKVYRVEFQPTRALIATWDQAVAYQVTTDFNPVATVTFQLVIVTDEADTYAMFIYGDMQWTYITQVGFNGGDGINYYSVDGSQTQAMIDIETTSNIDVVGKYMFILSRAEITAPPAPVCGDPCNGNGVCTNDALNQQFSCLCLDGFSGLDCLSGAGTC